MKRGLVENRAPDGGFELSPAQRAAILREVAGKLKDRNISACTFSCGSQKIKDEAVIHQRQDELLQLGTRAKTLQQTAKAEVVGSKRC